MSDDGGTAHAERIIEKLKAADRRRNMSTNNDALREALTLIAGGKTVEANRKRLAWLKARGITSPATHADQIVVIARTALAAAPERANK